MVKEDLEKTCCGWGGYNIEYDIRSNIMRLWLYRIIQVSHLESLGYKRQTVRVLTWFKQILVRYSRDVGSIRCVSWSGWDVYHSCVVGVLFNIKSDKIDENNEVRRSDSEVVSYPRCFDQKAEGWYVYKCDLCCCNVCICVCLVEIHTDMTRWIMPKDDDLRQ